MSDCSPSVKKLLKKENEIHVPASPFLKRLGYGTGVDVYSFQRSPVDNRVRSPWAIKMLSKKHKNTKYGLRLRREADLLRKLNHPHIVGFRAFVTTSTGEDCLAMEMAKSSLADLIETRSTRKCFAFEPEKILKVGLDISKALEYLHDTMLILHGDIKSHNILILGDFSNCKLCDFGVSLPLNQDGTVDYVKAGRDADYIGTPSWSAPEVLESKKNVTSKADIYSFGLVSWEMMALDIPNTLDDSFEEDLEEEDVNISFDRVYPNESRPAVPFHLMKKVEEYYNPLQIFYCCTVMEPKNRPTAHHANLFICKMINEPDEE